MANDTLFDETMICKTCGHDITTHVNSMTYPGCIKDDCNCPGFHEGQASDVPTIIIPTKDYKPNT